MCFVVLTVNNALLVLDKVILPNLDFSRWRLAAALVAVLLLLFGLVWEEE
jgi:hypothetical protein